ncbi:hypothetical protein EYF80_062936 [Liparis tanakae]|uniref:Uncharacterized protein n=1 Tax=Liparis tanakae TaxID=230148 RepID=A0A4Z2EF30_9TELE|nr:hypothetical protein EYF80_062936 [Liparis tanakae]
MCVCFVCVCVFCVCVLCVCVLCVCVCVVRCAFSSSPAPQADLPDAGDGPGLRRQQLQLLLLLPLSARRQERVHHRRHPPRHGGDPGGARRQRHRAAAALPDHAAGGRAPGVRGPPAGRRAGLGPRRGAADSGGAGGQGRGRAVGPGAAAHLLPPGPRRPDGPRGRPMGEGLLRRAAALRGGAPQAGPVPVHVVVAEDRLPVLLGAGAPPPAGQPGGVRRAGRAVLLHEGLREVQAVARPAGPAVRHAVRPHGRRHPQPDGGHLQLHLPGHPLRHARYAAGALAVCSLGPRDGRQPRAHCHFKCRRGVKND